MKFTIFKRLTFGYLAIMLLIIFLGIYVTFKLNQLNQLAHAIASVDGAAIRITENLLDAVFSQVSFEKKYLISKDQDFYRQFWGIKEYLAKDMDKLECLMDTSEKKELFAEAKGLYDRYVSLFKKEVDFVEKDQDYPRKIYKEGKEKIVDEINIKLREIIKIARSDRDKKIHASSQTSSHVLKVTTVTAGLAIIMGIIISFFNTRSINRPIIVLQEKTKEIAKGKFEEIPNIASPPEIKELANDFNVMCERLKELDEMKVDFISHVSHELRTPLMAIKEASSMLLEGTFANTPEKQHELLAITNEECERLIDSVNKILDLSRMEAKMMDYQFSECSLVPVIQKGILKLAPIAQRKKINLEIKPPPDLPLVKIDEERISQVVENLLGNALKYTLKGGKIVIDVSFKSDEKGFIEISVSDTGCGISRENLEDIFDKFKRIDSGRETVRGTGLGLSIAKYIIAAHGGKIWAESEPGKGSTFFFTLPVL
jgi:two-component system sensor histidine kinase GlrK